ncbi:hypothetical protein CF326_g1239 [Tilletia indica]|nr:hypothetical protein CF326_g1239 [Tilletia indica]
MAPPVATSTSSTSGANGANSVAPNPPSAENFTPPLSPLAALLAFRDVQRKRAEYWVEYTDAIDAHLRWSAARPRREEDDAGLKTETNGDDGVEVPQHRPSCAHAAGIDPTSAIAQTQEASSSSPPPPAEVNGPMLLQILNLVTQGLLSCSHQSRLLEAHLRNPATDESSTQTSLAPQPALARLLGTVQDLENRLLRTTVKRDQLRTNALHSGDEDSQDQTRITTSDGDAAGTIEELQRERHKIREEINEAMAEIQAEIAELQAEE